jgi:hypothetical protein
MSEVQKQVAYWEPKRVPVLKNGTFDGEYCGRFMTRVEPGFPGAVNYRGERDGRKWDFWGVHAGSVSGRLVWVDKRSSDFGTKFIVALEGKRLHILSLDYDIVDIRNVLNCVLAKKDELNEFVFKLEYWVRYKTDIKGKAQVNDQGKPLYAYNIRVRDKDGNNVEKYFIDWKGESQTRGLDWVQRVDASGKKFLDQSAEMGFWDARILGVQRQLMKLGLAVPLTYNSMIACNAPNPSGGGNLTEEEIQYSKDLFERIKGRYLFPRKNQSSDADEVFDSPKGPAPSPIDQVHSDPIQGNSAFPQEDPFANMDSAQPVIDDLPF